MALARILGGLGRVSITAGTLILLFVAYQLWGTGLYEARAQDDLSAQFEELVGRASAGSSPSGSTSTTSTAPEEPTTTTVPATTTTAPGATTTIAVEEAPPAPDDLPLPAYGDPVAKIRIPRIGITRTVVEGVGLDQLKRGPGHYEASPLPGQAGNVSIAGHRTTYGQPFHNVDDLEPGDQIETTTLQGTFVYEVTGTTIVKPDQVEVLEDKGDNRLTLIACHPKYSLRERIIVVAQLVGRPVPQLPGQEEARAETERERADDPAAASIDVGLSGRDTSNTPAIVWGVACASIWLATWLVSRLIRRRQADDVLPLEGRSGRGRARRRFLPWTPYLVGLPVFLVALFVFFENLNRLLPGNY